MESRCHACECCEGFFWSKECHMNIRWAQVRRYWIFSILITIYHFEKKQRVVTSSHGNIIPRWIQSASFALDPKSPITHTIWTVSSLTLTLNHFRIPSMSNHYSPYFTDYLTPLGTFLSLSLLRSFIPIDIRAVSDLLQIRSRIQLLIRLNFLHDPCIPICTDTHA